MNQAVCTHLDESTAGRRCMRHHLMRSSLLACCLAFTVHAFAGAPRADPALDAPEGTPVVATDFHAPASYAGALAQWRTPEDVNAWIGARFRYDLERAMALSETQRGRGPALAIAEPRVFYAAPQGVCVDLSRFAVETLRRIDPALSPRYLMIEFAPVEIAGNTLRRHWIASFVRDGRHYFFADSKRPGQIAGPYASVQAFVDDYAAYRGRKIVSFREGEDYRKRERTMASRRDAITAPAREDTGASAVSGKGP
jgi:hypothetical protein